MAKKPKETDGDRLLARYKEEIAYYEKESQPWSEKVRKILRRYKDERSPRESKTPRFNILYSNIATLLPAAYGRNPKADIERRFKDDDSLGRVTSEVLERSTDYFISTEQFRASMRSALFDRLTGGRGVVWSRYEPHFRDMEIQENEEVADEGYEVTQAVESEETPQEVYNEEAPTDYVHWSDFGHNWARTYDEIYLGWRRVYMSRRELIERFGEKIGKKIPLDYHPKGLNDQKKDIAIRKAVIYELWDKSTKMASWIHKDYEEFLDEKEDPLKLKDFFPFPKPVYGVLANDSMIPVPDYVEYQDQAQELDEITSRIGAITKAVKVAGVYDGSAPAIERLLAEGVENRLLPVEQWAVMSEKGGIKGVIGLLPMEEIMKTLLGLYEARDKVKADLNEISGVADIIRGNGDPNATATAERLKSNFATIRLSDIQDDMARFSRDAVQNVALIIANHFSMDTIKKISGVKLLTEQEKQQLQMSLQPPQQGVMSASAQPPAPPPPPIDDKTQEMLDNPTWEEVEALLRNEPMLCFKIDIETDSTIKIDEDAERDARVEFLKATGEFIQQASQIKDPTLMPLMAEMLMFGVRGFKVGRSIEGQFKVVMDKIEKAAKNPQPPPNPEMMKAQADIQINKAKAQAEQQENAQRMEMDKQKMAQESQLQQQKFQQEKELAVTVQQAQAQQNAAQLQNDLTLEREKMAMEFAFKEKEMNLQGEIDLKKHEASLKAKPKKNNETVSV